MGIYLWTQRQSRTFISTPTQMLLSLLTNSTNTERWWWSNYRPRSSSGGYKVFPYTDDLLIFVSDPVSCAPHIIYVLRSFCANPGYKLNFSKSECYPVNNLALQIQDCALPFKISAEHNHLNRFKDLNGFKYLGIITRGLQNFYQENFCPLFGRFLLSGFAALLCGETYCITSCYLVCVLWNFLPLLDN